MQEKIIMGLNVAFAQSDTSKALSSNAEAPILEQSNNIPESQRNALRRAQDYAKRYLKRHPNTKPDRLQKIVAKKFNIKIT